jgi:hypothetical protein
VQTEEEKARQKYLDWLLLRLENTRDAKALEKMENALEETECMRAIAEMVLKDMEENR